MPNSSLQLSQLISRLWEKTQAGQIRWEQLSDRAKYQTRQGDFVISLSGNLGGGLGAGSASIEVKRLSGAIIAQGGVGILNALSTVSAMGGNDRLTSKAETDLKLMFEYVSDRSPDLEELLRTLD